MKIKEAEERTGLKKANIRYYEQEGLLEPRRNVDNNYREYTEKEIVILERIKFLRMLGVSIRDIRQYQIGRVGIDELMLNRLCELEREINQREMISDICRRMRQKNVSFQELEISDEIERTKLFRIKGEMFMKTDKSGGVEKQAENIRGLLCGAAALWGILFFIVTVILEEVISWEIILVHLMIVGILLGVYICLRWRRGHYKH